MYFTNSLQNETNFIGLHLWAPPIVDVILKIAVSDPESELVEKFHIVHQIQGIEHIKIQLRCQDQRVAHQISPRNGLSHIVEGVGGFDAEKN